MNIKLDLIPAVHISNPKTQEFQVDQHSIFKSSRLLFFVVFVDLGLSHHPDSRSFENPCCQSKNAATLEIV
jgi:hypothetical protein